MKSHPGFQATLICAALASAGIGPVALAHVGNNIPSAVHACVGAFGGIRIVGVNGVCNGTEHAEHWAILGPDGPAGPKGPAGADGKPGPQGSQGSLGPTGAQGSIGAQGPIGQRGNDGTNGPQGHDGLSGAQGARGPGGERGPGGVRGFAEFYLVASGTQNATNFQVPADVTSAQVELWGACGGGGAGYDLSGGGGGSGAYARAVLATQPGEVFSLVIGQGGAGGGVAPGLSISNGAGGGSTQLNGLSTTILGVGGGAGGRFGILIGTSEHVNSAGGAGGTPTVGFNPIHPRVQAILSRSGSPGRRGYTAGIIGLGGMLPGTSVYPPLLQVDGFAPKATGGDGAANASETGGVGCNGYALISW